MSVDPWDTSWYGHDDDSRWENDAHRMNFEDEEEAA